MKHRDLLVMPLVDLVQGDVHDPAFLQRVLTGADAAVNLVGIFNEPRGGDGFRRVHTELTASLVRACKAHGPRRVLQMSAVNAASRNARSLYLRTKGEAEDALRKSALDYTIYRASAIFGPHDSFISRFAKLLRLSPVLPLPRLRTAFAPVFVEDVATALNLTLDDSSTYGRTYELCGPEIRTLRQILEYICATLDIKRLVLELPDPIGKLEAALVDFFVPGKPFSLDNFRMLGAASLCHDDGLSALGIEATPMSAVVPTMLLGSK